MNTIVFPMINLKLHVQQIAFSIFGIDIYWYAIIIVSSMLLALFVYKRRNGYYNIKYNDIIDLLIYLLPISIISARLYYVVFNLKKYVANPMLILNIREGGLAFYGGIIGGLITCYMFCKNRKISLLNLLDYLIPGVALRPINRKVGKFYKCRSIWNHNNTSLENGNI